MTNGHPRVAGAIHILNLTGASRGAVSKWHDSKSGRPYAARASEMEVPHSGTQRERSRVEAR